MDCQRELSHETEYAAEEFTYPLMSCRSQLCPAHVTVLTLFPSPVFVTPQLQTKHVRPALDAWTQVPLPEQDDVELLHTSRVVKHADIDPIGCWGEGEGVWEGAGSWRLNNEEVEGGGRVIIARLKLLSSRTRSKYARSVLAA